MTVKTALLNEDPRRRQDVGGSTLLLLPIETGASYLTLKESNPAKLLCMASSVRLCLIHATLGD